MLSDFHSPELKIYSDQFKLNLKNESLLNVISRETGHHIPRYHQQ